jgi:hypothetical protein
MIMTVKLSDNELALIETSLALTIASASIADPSALDEATKKVIEEMKLLKNKLKNII